MPSFDRLHARHYVIAAALAAALLQPPYGHADTAEFQAMPGLWKVVTRQVDHGHAGPPATRWMCVDEAADPWDAFTSALRFPEQVDCQRSAQQRGITQLAWDQRCAGSATLSHGRLDLQSPEHYSASLSEPSSHRTVHVTGQRLAACTSPSD